MNIIIDNGKGCLTIEKIFAERHMISCASVCAVAFSKSLKETPKKIKKHDKAG